MCECVCQCECESVCVSVCVCECSGACRCTAVRTGHTMSAQTDLRFASQTFQQ